MAPAVDGVQEKMDPLDSRSYSPPSRSVEFLAIQLFTPISPLTYVYPRSFLSPVPSDFVGFLEPRTTGSNRNKYGMTNHSASSWENDVQQHGVGLAVKESIIREAT